MTPAETPQTGAYCVVPASQNRIPESDLSGFGMGRGEVNVLVLFEHVCCASSCASDSMECERKIET